MEPKKTVSRDLLRPNVSKPLKDLNYRDSSQKQIMSDTTKHKQKISLAEYRERAKSKSPAKPGTEEKEGDVKESRKNYDSHDEISEMAHLVNPSIREERDVSVEDVFNVSTDLANMSIGSSDTYLDEKSGVLIENGDVIVGKESVYKGKNASKDKERLKLKKSSMTLTAGEGISKTTDSDDLSSSAKLSKGNGQETKKKDAGCKSDFTLSLSERLRIKSGGSQSSPEAENVASKSSASKTEMPCSPDVIDLTEDEESPSVAPVRSNNPPIRTLASSAKEAPQPIRIIGTFGDLNQNPVASFQSLNKESAKVKTLLKEAPQWSQPREQVKEKNGSGQVFRSVSEVLRDMEGSSETGTGEEAALLQSVQRDIARRNELSKLFEKQKVLVSTVKMSSLPDGGEKLRTNLDILTSNIRELTIQIQQKTAALNKIQAERKNEHQENLTMEPSQAQDSQLSKQPRVIKIYPAGTTSSQPEAHKPHNPENLRQTTLLPHVAQIPPHILQQMYAANPQAMQLYGGRMTADRLRQVGSVTKEAIERLHKQLETCPKPTEELEDPDGLLVPLMTHQRQALMWLVWRERQTPSGGILADDMGLGKTLTMISLILKQQQLRESGSEDEKKVWLNRDAQLEKMGKSVVKSSATLIVCPASLIHHWRTEIERRCKSGLLRVCMYHGQNRERNVLKLASCDVVLTTYNIVSKEVELDDTDKKGERPVKDEAEEEENKEGVEPKPKKDLPNIMRIAWERIILDEGHNIKNHKSLQSRAVSRLRAGFRWALTGTPIQNDLLDMYSILRFLRCSPFDEYKVWKRQVDTGNATGHNRLNVLVKTLLLRRTKSQTGASGKPLVPLPEKSSTTHELQLSEEERKVYDRVFAQSRSVMKEYLKRHEEKELLKDGHIPPKSTNPFMDRAPGTGASSQSSPRAEGAVGTVNAQPTGQHILVMLLRLRQCCSHLSLMKDALDDETQENEGLELTLEEQMMDLMLNDDAEKEPTVKKSSKMFEKEAMSTKMKALLDQLREIHRPAESKDRCKSVIVSQWTKMLDLVALHLQSMNIRSCVIQGNIPAKKRMESVDQFNNDKHGPEVMLVSLRAGGCGLNLIGGNHLFLLDSHWNPALEDQACDRIYRVGQKKNVYIHRFLCKDTVEEKILQLQRRKQDLAKNVLSGSAMSKTKLTLQDLRMLFGV